MSLSPTLLYQILLKKLGNLYWWPMDNNYHKKNKSDPRFEVIIGAILTQNTSWSNVEKALENLKSDRKLNIKSIADANLKNLTKIIKPSGFFNQKAQRIQTLSKLLKDKYNYNLDNFFNRNIKIIRKELVSIKGIGLETADSILLYAGDKPIFVVDAYTKRICNRLPLDTETSYDEIQLFFENDLSKNYEDKMLTKVYGELHAQIVILAKDYCRKKPNCTDCPLLKVCMFDDKLF